jgi:hypothetical protein
MNCPYCGRPIAPKLITAAHNAQIAKRKRPGAVGLIRNPKGRPPRRPEHPK